MKYNMIEEFSTLPEAPEDFEEWCYSHLEAPRIYYRRNGKIANCFCAKCGAIYITQEIPVRGEDATCTRCGNEGEWEWKRVSKTFYDNYDVMLLQKTTTNDLVARKYNIYRSYSEGNKERRTCTETKRYFLHMGDVCKVNSIHTYTEKGWGRRWDTSGNGEAFCYKYVYPNWQQELKESNLRYAECVTRRPENGKEHRRLIDVLMAYANNPAIEMYEKAGMKELARHLIWKEGKTKLVNRRAKTPIKQLRLKDKAALNELIEHQGDINLLEMLQMEAKSGVTYTPEQKEFILRLYKRFDGKERVKSILKHMTVQKLMNRVEKYKKQEEKDEYRIIAEYDDYLKMREGLGYDMTNEVYLYPRNLKEKHDQMVKEQNERKDELHIARMMKKYPKIEKRYKSLCKKYQYESDGYLIRPARHAGEIVMEGRLLHHCVGGERYLGSHNDGETSILFLRKTQAPDTPYYTIEIKDKTILQWYGIKDGKPDKEIIGPWLEEYVEHLKKRRKPRKNKVAA